ncbi:MAG: ABC transporter substrate-binding protein [Proteobacteria bacterium]|nr:ABC transporter substrate-binding protein [Pseudomonadota bacterium]
MARIRIMVSRHSAFYSPLIATIAGGFLKEEGLEADYSAATPERPIGKALAEGAADCAQAAVSYAWGPLEKGQPSDIVHFAQINARDGFFLAARAPDPGFRWDRLAGRKLLVDHGAQPLAMFKYACHRMGLDYGAIQSLDRGGVEAIDRAFRAGEADYVHQQGPAPQQLEKDGAGHVVASVGAAIGPVAFSSLCARRPWLETNTARAFMRAYRKARAWVIGSPAQEVAKAEAPFFKAVDAEVLAATIAAYQKLGCWEPEVRIARALYEVSLDVFLHSGLITRRHPYEQVVVAPPG